MFKKGIILFCLITILFTSIAYAGIIEEILGKVKIITRQRQQREPVEIELQGNKNIRDKFYIYITSIKEKNPKKPKK